MKALSSSSITCSAGIFPPACAWECKAASLDFTNPLITCMLICFEPAEIFHKGVYTLAYIPAAFSQGCVPGPPLAPIRCLMTRS